MSAAAKVVHLAGGAALVGLLVVAGVTAATATPDGLKAADTPTTAPVEAAQFGDERSTPVHVVRSQSSALRVNRGGTVTQLDCAPGGTVDSGRVAVWLDDTPVLALSTTTPLYRDLGPGAKGRDVWALQTELVALGQPVTVDGTYGARTRAAVLAVKKAAGMPSPDGSLTLAGVVWLPGRHVVLASCEARPGDRLEAGGDLATPATTLTGLRLDRLPSSATPGARTFELWGVSGPLPEDSVVTDRELLDRIAATPEYATTSAAADAEPPKATVALAQPVAVSKVPPASVFGVDGHRGCVRTGDGRTVPVTIVGSGLGASLVSGGSGPLSGRVVIGAGLTGLRCEGGS